MITLDRWSRSFFEHAIVTSRLSKDPKAQVGAVIVDDRNRIISSGFNGLPSGVDFDWYLPKPVGTECVPDIRVALETERKERADRLACTIHAEENALAFAWRDVKGMTLFCTRHPCARCAAMIVQRGISSVAYLVGNDTINPDWQRSFELAHEMFMQADVLVLEVERMEVSSRGDVEYREAHNLT